MHKHFADEFGKIRPNVEDLKPLVKINPRKNQWGNQKEALIKRRRFHH